MSCAWLCCAVTQRNGTQRNASGVHRALFLDLGTSKPVQGVYNHYEPVKLMGTSERNPEALQRKLYFLLDQLQGMARELPPKYQMRVPIELLSGLANCLLDDTVFDIVKGLMEIQHVTEKHLFQQRLQIINKHTLEIQNMINTVTNPDELELQRSILLQRHKEELKQTDMKLVMQLDQKVSDQQVTLEKTGVPGFFVTNKPIEIKVQMYLLDFILRLSRMDIPQV